MNIYGQGQAFYNDLIYPISPMYSTGLAELLDREVDGHDVIEFGVGTGRIAFPLLTRGYNVIGIDRSNAMLNELGHRDEDNLITKVKADFSIPLEALEPHQADAILLVCNAIFEAKELAAQRGVFANARRLLKTDGIFVVETVNPFPFLTVTGPRLRMQAISNDTLMFENTEVDPFSQRLTTTFLFFRAGEQPYSYKQSIRLMFPNEMDAIAASEGLTLRSRMAWWDGERANATSPHLISMYERADI